MRISGNAFGKNTYLTTPAKVGPLPIGLFRLLGLNTRYYSPGCRLCTLPPAEYAARARELDSLGTQGIYPFHQPTRISALGMALAGEIECLPDDWRVIGVPQQNGYSLLTIAHEVLHDIYFSRNFGITLRKAFVSAVLEACRSLGPFDAFLHGVANKSALKTTLTDILSKKDDVKIMREPEFQCFAAECFAYAGETLIDNDLGEINGLPTGIIQFFREKEVVVPVPTRERRLAAVAA